MSHSAQLPGRTVFSATTSPKARLAFGAAAMLPLLAPYELLIKPVWAGTSSLAWLFPAIISLGAIAVSVFLLLGAISGVDQRVEFDAERKTVRVMTSSPLRKKRECNCRFREIARLEVICRDWSDGPATYRIRLTPRAGKPFAFGEFSSRGEAESALSSLVDVTGGTL